MLYFECKQGESLLIQTPRGSIVVTILADEEIGIEVPPGTDVQVKDRDDQEGEKPTESWLPPRPGKPGANN